MHGSRQGTSPQVYTCGVCGSQWMTYISLMTHVIGCDKYSCKVCGQSVKGRDPLTSHMITEHDYVSVIFCKYCGKYFKSQSGCQIHTNIWHNPDSNCPKCKTCGKVFGSLSRLKVHEQKHNSEHCPFVCGLCGNKYKYQCSLKTHKCRPVEEDINN